MITEVRQMQVEDMLSVMADNAELFPEFAAMPNEQKRNFVNINILTGQALSYLENGKLMCVGGIRSKGVGEAWMITPASIRAERGLELFNDTKEHYKQMRDSQGFWRVFAENSISKVFLERLGFEKHPEGFLWTRT